MQKSLIHKIAITTLLWSLVFCTLTAQGEPLKLHALSTGIGFYSPVFPESAGGLSMNLDIAVKLSDNIFSMYFHEGFSEQLICEETFTLMSLNYGSYLNLSKWWFLEGHIGIGYIRQNNSSISFNFHYENVGYSISFPFSPKILSRQNDPTSIGVNPNFNFNVIQTFFALDSIVQFNFL